MLLAADLPDLVPQVVVLDEGGHRIARLDLAVEELLLGIEVDGRRGHAGELMVAKDRLRDAATSRRGWTVERMGWYDVRRRPEATRRRVLQTASQLRAARLSA